MPITMSLSADDLDQEALQQITRQMCRDLGDEAGLSASPSTRLSEAGEKGEIEIIGQILIKAVGAGGAIVALVNVLKAYIQRKPSLQVKIHTKGGHDLTIKADDLRGDDMTKLIQTIEKSVEGMND